MRSIGQGISPQAALWEAMREAARLAEATDSARRELDAEEAESLATRHAEARRARRRASQAATATLARAAR